MAWTQLQTAMLENTERSFCVGSFAFQTESHSRVLSELVPVGPGPAVAPCPPVAPTPAPAPAKKETSYFRISHKHVDPIAIGLEHKDPLYGGASDNVKKEIEREHALEIEKVLQELYKSESGRSRGWTKAGLDGMLQPRCASGGDLYELDRMKKGFIWQLVCDDKPLSAFLDFLCVAKNIRICIWFQDEKRAVMYPAADRNHFTEDIPLYHVSCKGTVIHTSYTSSELPTVCKKLGYVLLPPVSVLQSLQTLTLAELESVGKKLGMDDIAGTKASRIAAIASYKLMQRLEQ